VTQPTEGFWDEEAATFDDEPDHGLADLDVRAAWRALMQRVLPAAPATVVDLGCGTGSLSILLAEAGYTVCGVDFSAEMLRAAKVKAATAGVGADFVKADAADPPVPAQSFDVVLGRHVLWMMRQPEEVLSRWVRLLRPASGVLVLIEGRWGTGAGLPAATCQALVLQHRQEAAVERLDDQPALWGRAVADERYLLVSRW
jgi:ubiquinone/menaquinone biosynthesis C-methylase UbiE